MGHLSAVKLDLAKLVFQVHGINAQGEAILRRRLARGQLLKLTPAQNRIPLANEEPPALGERLCRSPLTSLQLH